jgi:hypothetical protein
MKLHKKKQRKLSQSKLESSKEITAPTKKRPLEQQDSKEKIKSTTEDISNKKQSTKAKKGKT